MSKFHHFLIFVIALIPEIASRGGQSMINGFPVENVPYMVSIRDAAFDDPFGSGHLCGGSILTFNLILTTASCVENSIPANVLIIAGTHMRFDQTAAFTANARAIFIHPNYNFRDRSNNVALIEVISLPRNALNIQPINLTNDLPLAGDTCNIFGFGQSRSLTGPQQLLVGVVTVVDDSACHDRRNNIVCAGHDTWPCNGDEGGPMVCDNVVTALIDFFDFNHCRSDVTSRHISYISIHPYRQWIDEHVRRIGLEIDVDENTASHSKISSILLISVLAMKLFMS